MTELRKRKSKKKWRFWKKIGSKTRNLCEVGLHFQPKFFCYYRKQLNHSRIIWIITSGVKCSFSFFRFRYLISIHFNLFIRTPKELAVLRCFRKRCSWKLCKIDSKILTMEFFLMHFARCLKNTLFVETPRNGYPWQEAVVRTCSLKKVFSKISQNSQENTCARVSFSTKLQASGQQLYSKIDYGTGVFLWILENF